MEHIAKHLHPVKAQEPQNLPTILKTNSEAVLTPEEREVIEVKYKSKRIELMDGAEVSKWTKALLLKIHVITGWVIPDDGPLYSILIDQFQKHLTEKYFELNPDEIEYAFRKSGTVIEDWGKSMNLNLMDKVLLPYLNDRYRISEVERQIVYKKKEKPFSLENIDYRRMINEDYLNYLTGWKFEVFPVHYYKQLVEDGYIVEDKSVHYIPDDKAKDDLVKMVFERAKESGIVNLYEK